MENGFTVIEGNSTPTSKRHMEMTFLLSRLEKEGALLSEFVKTKKGHRKMYYPAPQDEQERKEFLKKVKSGEIPSETFENIEDFKKSMRKN